MDGHNGVSVTSNSRITCTYAGVYNIQFSLQMHNLGGGGNGTSVWIWIRKNGVDIADTATNVEVITNSPYIVPAWNFILSANAGDFFELMWATNNLNIVIQYETPKSFCPAIPSAILTVQEVAAVLIPSDITGNANTVTHGVYTTDTGTVTNTMLAGSITNNKLANSSVTINGSTISLGSTSTITAAANTLTGLSLNPSIISSNLSSVGTLSNLSINSANTGTVLSISGTPFQPVGQQTWAFKTSVSLGQPLSWINFPDNTNQYTAYTGNANTVTNGVYTTDTGTVTATMLAGNITNNKLANSSVTINGSTVSLGSTSTITAAANTLTSNTLNSTVVNSSLTSVGTLSNLTVAGGASPTGGVESTHYINIGQGHMFDDGNFHLHTKGGDLWLNTLESGRYVQLNTQGVGAGVKMGGDVISTTPFQGKSPFNSALNTEVVVDNLKYRIANSGGIFPQIESNTAGTVDVCWSILGVVSGAGTTSNENSGTLVANNAWTTLYSTHGMDTRGDNLVAHITDKNAGRIYRATFMVTNNSGNTTGYNIVVERIL